MSRSINLLRLVRAKVDYILRYYAVTDCATPSQLRWQASNSRSCLCRRRARAVASWIKLIID
jgi:hypothetical protein